MIIMRIKLIIENRVMDNQEVTEEEEILTIMEETTEGIIKVSTEEMILIEVLEEAKDRTITQEIEVIFSREKISQKFMLVNLVLMLVRLRLEINSLVVVKLLLLKY